MFRKVYLSHLSNLVMHKYIFDKETVFVKRTLFDFTVVEQAE